MTQLEVTQKLMAALNTHTFNSSTNDGTTYSPSKAMLDEAIRASTHYSGIDEARNAFLSDMQNSTSREEAFQKCGIDTTNSDTGSITGYDVNPANPVKTQDTIVLETGNLYRAAMYSDSQIINTGNNGWLVEATAYKDTITSGGEDSINAGAGNDLINLSGRTARIVTGGNYDTVSVAAGGDVKTFRIEDYVSGKTVILGASNYDSVLNGSVATFTLKGFSSLKSSHSYATDAAVIDSELSSSLSGPETSIDATAEKSLAYEKPKEDDIPTYEDIVEFSTEALTGTAPYTVDLSTVNTLSGYFASGNSDFLIYNPGSSCIGTVSSHFDSSYLDRDENGNLSFVSRGLKVNIKGERNSDTGQMINAITAYNIDSFNNPNSSYYSQYVMIANLYKWWIKEGLELNEESLGFGFTDKNVSVNEIDQYFEYDDSDSSLAYVRRWSSAGKVTRLELVINTYYFGGITDESDPNGDGYVNNRGGRLDQTIAHEINHAVLGANVNYFGQLPMFFKEGAAELIRGIDNTRYDTMTDLLDKTINNHATNLLADYVDLSLNNSNQVRAGESNYPYGAGYMFLRWLAKTAAEASNNDGDDYVENADSNILIDTGAGNDTIVNSGNFTTIDAGTGDDSIENSGNNSKVLGAGGKDTLNNGNIVTTDVVSPDGINTTVYSAGGTNVTLSGGDEADQIQNDVHKLNTSTGKYERVTENVNVVMNGDNGDDTLVNHNSGVTMNGGDGDDYIKTYVGGDLVINTGLGVDNVDITDSSDVTVNAYGDSGSIRSKLPYDNTSKSPDRVLINIGAGNYRVTTYGQRNTIVAGDGDNDILHGFPTDDTGSNSTISVGNGANTIANYGNDVSISAGRGANLISAWGSQNIVTAGNGNNTLQSGGDNNTIHTGNGNNSVNSTYSSNLSLTTGDGSDTVELIGDKSVTVDSGAGADLISIGDGINAAANQVTVIGGADNDTIKNYGNDVTIIHNNGDGFDRIEGFNETSTLQIGDGTGTYSKATLDNDIVVTVGEGKITLVGAASLSTLNIEGTEVVPDNPKLITLSEGNDTHNNSLDNVTILALGGKDSIFNYAANVSISGGEGDDTIDNIFNSTIDDNSNISINSADSVTIDGGVGDDKITNYWENSNVIINGGVGNDSIDNQGEHSSIDAGDGNDSVYNSGSNVTINAGYGADSIENSGDSVTINGGEDNDTITNWWLGDSVSIDGGAGNDSIRNEGGENVTITTGDGNDYIFNSSLSSGVTIDAGADDDTIDNYGDNVSIDGGAGNDSIRNEGSENVKITTGDGSDTIEVGRTVQSFTVTDFSAGDVIELASSVSSIAVVNNSLVAGSVTIGGINSLSEEQIVWSISGGIATCTKKTSGGVQLSDDGKTIVFASNETTEQLFTVYGLASTATTADLSFNDKTNIITVSQNALGKSDITLLMALGLPYKLALGADVPTPQPIDGGWKLSGTTATFSTGGTTEGCELSDDGKSISFVAADEGSTLVTVKGVTSLDGLKLNGKVVTVSNASIGTNDISISGTGYTLALGADVPTPQPIDGGWKLSGTTATFSTGGTTEGYELSKDAQTISFVAADEGSTLVTVRGVTSLDGLKLNGKVVTVSSASIGTNDISISGTGYTLALGADVPTPQPIDGGWKLSGTTATFSTGGTTEGCELSDDAKSISFIEASEDSDALVTVDGMKSVKGLGVNGDTVKIDPKSIDSKTKSATVSGSDYTFELTGSGRLFAGENTILKGSGKNDTLIADVAATLDGGAGKDVYVYGGGDVEVEYSAGDKISLGAGIEIVGVAEDDDDISLTLSKDDEESSLLLNGVTSNTKVDLVTTSVVKGKNKATSSSVYFADGMIVDNNTAAKIKKVTVFDGEADFSELDGKNAKYKSLATITAAAENNVVGTEKNNTIVLQSGGAATGGLGNDTFIIEGGDVTIEDFGIGAKKTVSDSDVLVANLATKVTATEAVTKKATTIFSGGDKDTVEAGAITSYAYENEIGRYAEGADVVKVGGAIKSIEFDGLEGDKGEALTEQTFSVTITYGDDETVTLNNIMREVSQVKGNKNTDTAVVFAKNASVDAQALKIEYYDSDKGKYVKVGKKDLLNWFNNGNGDMPADDLMTSDNFTGDELGDIMTTSTSDALTGEIFTDDPTVIAPLQATFTSSAKK